MTSEALCKQTVYVKLLGEGIDVWRPAQAYRAKDNMYIILNKGYDPGFEEWEFIPGDVVYTSRVRTPEGSFVRAIRAVQI